MPGIYQLLGDSLARTGVGLKVELSSNFYLSSYIEGLYAWSWFLFRFRTTVAEHCMGSCGSSVETYRAGVGRIGKNFSDYIASFRIASFARDVVESWKGDAYIHTKSCKQGVSLACYVGVDA